MRSINRQCVNANLAPRAILSGVWLRRRINPFGHLGDGNIHYNLSPPVGGGFAGAEAALSAAIFNMADAMGGSFAAEHGLGRAKVALADRLRAPVEREIMQRLKHALDPTDILNPDIIVPKSAGAAPARKKGHTS